MTRDENLYRVIKRSQPDTIDAVGRPTPALFKQDDGVSVDRDGGRSEEDIIGTFRSRFTKRFKGLVRVGADICIDHSMAVIPAVTDNVFHAEIFNDTDKTPLSSLNALILSDHAQIIMFDSTVTWSV